MQSSVTNYIDYQKIPIPEDLLTIEIPSWDAVAQPLVDYAEEQYAKMTGQEWSALTDEKVAALNLPGIDNLAQLKQYGMETYQKNQENYQYFEQVLPFILKFYRQTANTVMDRSEKEAYVKEYIEQVEAYAQAEGRTLRVYARDRLKLEFEGDVRDILEERALEDFTFKLIAQDIFNQSGRQLNEETYESFIMQNVLHNQADEIELREQIPYQRYLKMIPEMELSQEMFQYYVKQMKIKINPGAEVRLFKNR